VNIIKSSIKTDDRWCENSIPFHFRIKMGNISRLKGARKLFAEAVACVYWILCFEQIHYPAWPTERWLINKRKGLINGLIFNFEQHSTCIAKVMIFTKRILIFLVVEKYFPFNFVNTYLYDINYIKKNYKIWTYNYFVNKNTVKFAQAPLYYAINYIKK